MKPSPKYTMNREDWKSFGRGVLKYFGPLMLVFLVSIQAGMPLRDAMALVWAGLLQLAINFLSKFLDGK